MDWKVIKGRITGLYRVHRNLDLDVAGALGRIQLQLAFDIVKAAMVGTGTEVANGKARIGMVSVELIGFSQCAGAQGGSQQTKGKMFFHDRYSVVVVAIILTAQPNRFYVVK